MQKLNHIKNLGGDCSTVRVKSVGVPEIAGPIPVFSNTNYFFKLYGSWKYMLQRANALQ